MIDIHELVKRRGDRAVIDGLCLKVAPGETVAITGPSGSGKTSLLRLIAGLEIPDSGDIRLGGRLLDRLEAAHTRGIAFLFQSASLWPHMSVARNILFGIHDRPGGWRQARVRHLLECVGMAAFAQRSPSSLSGGEARRVALARALAPQRPILFLDEPTSNLDAALREQVLELIAQECASHGTTVLLATHEQAEVNKLADRCLTLRAGRLETGSTA